MSAGGGEKRGFIVGDVHYAGTEVQERVWRSVRKEGITEQDSRFYARAREIAGSDAYEIRDGVVYIRG